MKTSAFSRQHLLGRAPEGFPIGRTVLGNDNDDRFCYPSYHHTHKSASYTQSLQAQKSDLIHKIIFSVARQRSINSGGGGNEQGNSSTVMQLSKLHAHNASQPQGFGFKPKSFRGLRVQMCIFAIWPPEGSEDQC